MSAPMHLTGWRLNAGDELTVMDGTGARLVSVNCGGPTGRTVREGEDCARLISAAPELLEALEALMAIRSECFIPNEGDWWDNLANAAIAKARGAA